jgi:redox-sensitive bicupin YhaK (pirin superfamily)
MKVMIKRNIENVKTLTYHPGFLGTGHQAAQIVGQQGFEYTDPFIVLMDDNLDLSGAELAGGAHPHAGVEIYTFVLEGNHEDAKKGNLEVMNSGTGVIHTEEIKGKIQSRVLQLWVALPPEKRQTKPSLQTIDVENVPLIKNERNEIRVYSGSSYGLTSPMQTNASVTIVDFKLRKYAVTNHILPASYNGLIFVTEGSVRIGDVEISQGQTAWLNKTDKDGDSEIVYKAGNEGVRFILYAGQPQYTPIVAHGPFVASSQEEISQLYKAYRSGELKHIRSYPTTYFSSKKGETMN